MLCRRFAARLSSSACVRARFLSSASHGFASARLAKFIQLRDESIAARPPRQASAAPHRVTLLPDALQDSLSGDGGAGSPGGSVSVVEKERGWKPSEFLKGRKDPSDSPIVAARVNGRLRDLSDPVWDVGVDGTVGGDTPQPVTLQLISFKDPEGQQIYWHSAAHVLGAALEACLGDAVQLADGPPLDAAEGGFFYEFFVDPVVGTAAAAAATAAAKGAPVALPGSSANAIGGKRGAPKSAPPSSAPASSANAETLAPVGGAAAGANAGSSPPPAASPHYARLMAALAGTDASAAAASTAAGGGGGGAPLRVGRPHFPILQDAISALVRARPPFERLLLSRAQALELFADAPLKAAVIARLDPSEAISAYRCGDFVDLCRGPHVPHAGLFRPAGFKLYRDGGSDATAVTTTHIVRSVPPTAAAATSAAAQALPLSPAAGAVAEVGAALEGGAIATPSSEGEVASSRGPAAATEAPPQRLFLQRIYGIAFPAGAEQLAAWQERIDRAAASDHRLIGKAQKLFFFHDMSPGSAFMLPHGTRIYNRLVSFLREEYTQRGYEEVMTPLLYRRALWETSGHLATYAENMFSVSPGMAPAALGGASNAAAPPALVASPATCADESHNHIHGGAAGGTSAPHSCGGSGAHDASADFGLKPMNCPGHCLIFAQRSVSYKELPMRLADFSTLHRNEASGALGGLTRLRRFQQDDAHIFCTPEQVHAEVHDCLSFVSLVYGTFGFTFRVKLSTRPPVSIGDASTWALAEGALRSALASFEAQQQPRAAPQGSQSPRRRASIEVDEGGGAFYGPKLDVFVRDALGREHQCATIQLDFQLPARFELRYTDARGAPAQPVMIHRAILGSLERFMGVLIEHTAGRWPFWVSPRQVVICSVSERHGAYVRAAAACVGGVEAPPRAAAAAAAAGGDAQAEGAGREDESEGPPPSSSYSWQRQRFERDGAVYCDVDETPKTIPKKVREAQVAQYNIIAVAGDDEARRGTLSVRCRDAETLRGLVAALEVLKAGRGGGGGGAGTAAGGAKAAAPEEGGGGAWTSPLLDVDVEDLRLATRIMLRRPAVDMG